MSYAKSQMNRQAILDHLHANPSKSAKAIADSIGISRNSVESCVRFMLRREEISRTGQGSAVRYTARAKTTISAEQVIAEMHDKRSASGKVHEKAQHEHGIISRPGYYCQRGGGWEPKSGKEGQGSGRQRVWVGSAMA